MFLLLPRSLLLQESTLQILNGHILLHDPVVQVLNGHLLIQDLVVLVLQALFQFGQMSFEVLKLLEHDVVRCGVSLCGQHRVTDRQDAEDEDEALHDRRGQVQSCLWLVLQPPPSWRLIQLLARV